MSVVVYIGAGSNLGNRFENLKSAWLKIQGILDQADFSSLWETAPLIVEDQPEFLNMVFKGLFSGSSISLLKKLQSIESDNGRDRSKEVLKGPRTLDLDLLLFGGESFQSDTLVLPHPGIQIRSFVLTPLLEIYPEDGTYADDYKLSLKKITDQQIICRRERTIMNFWESRDADEQ